MSIKIIDFNKYILTHNYEYSTVREVDNSDVLFDILSELIAEKHPESSNFDRMVEDFRDSDLDIRNFIEKKFEKYVSKEVQEEIISSAHKNKWINYKVEWMISNL